MNDPSSLRSGAPDPGFGEPGRAEMQSALFAQMVIQQSNLAMMMMGKGPHAENREALRDLEAAKLFIDQLEVLEAKTQGNLNKDEAALLKQSLMALHLAFVQAVEAKPAEPSAAAPEAAPAAPENKTAPAEAAGAVSEEESRKRFSKKY